MYGFSLDDGQVLTPEISDKSCPQKDGWTPVGEWELHLELGLLAPWHYCSLEKKRENETSYCNWDSRYACENVNFSLTSAFPSQLYVRKRATTRPAATWRRQVRT